MPSASPRIARLVDRLAAVSATPAAAESDLVWAAVALVLVSDPDAVLLIRRAERVGDPWSGHMALPGGRHAPADGALLNTAIRESEEEVGLQLTESHCIGVLDDVVPRSPVLPPIAVRPYVFSVPTRLALIPNPEVAATYWVTLDELLHPSTHHPVRIDIHGEHRLVEAFQVEHGIIWGMTERILSSLLQLLNPSS